MKSTTDIIISGGGTPGLVLGSLLGQAGFSVTICDPYLPKADAKLSGRTAALMGGSLRILQSVSLTQDIANIGAPIEILSIIDQNNRIDLRCEELNLPCFGRNLPNAQLQYAAYKKFIALKNTGFIQTSIESIKQTSESCIVQFADGQEIFCQLLVGADGRNSKTRELSGIEATYNDYGQIALTGYIRHSKRHYNASLEFHYSGGPCTFVPMQDDMSSFVWVEKESDAKKLLKLNHADLQKTLQNKSRNALGKIELIASIESWPLKIQHSNSLVGPRVALIAEAAHVLSPIGAQGLNLSLRDAAALAEAIITQARLGLDIGDRHMLEKYQSARKVDTQIRLRGTDMLNRLVANDHGFARALRRAGFVLSNKNALFRDILMRESLLAEFSFGDYSGLTTRAKVKTSTRAAPAA